MECIPVRITCFGDSITEGIGACPMDAMSYPSQLRRMLGERYEVLNMGASGLTLQKEGDYPYYKDPRYASSFDSRPDIVIIMIGTNDSKKHNWVPERYADQLDAVIRRFRSLETRPRIIVSSCCTAFSDIDTISNEVISGVMRDIQRKAALDNGAEFFDMTSATEAHPEWFCDCIHPSNEGYAELAGMFKKIICK